MGRKHTNEFRTSADGKERIWEYGTSRLVEVIEITSGVLKGVSVDVVHCVETCPQPEGFMLLNSKVPKDLKVGDKRQIIFTEGGPYGGHWEFEV